MKTNKIKDLNKAHKNFETALKLIKKSVKKTDEVDLYLYRIEKNIVALNQVMLKQLHEEIEFDTFKKIIKNF